VHFEIDNYEVDKIRRAEVAVVADLAHALRDLLVELQRRSSAGWHPANAGCQPSLKHGDGSSRGDMTPARRCSNPSASSSAFVTQ
jgi:thiamine pyrophosphate-dependent acetolactate synthase large subunit-like protein